MAQSPKLPGWIAAVVQEEARRNDKQWAAIKVGSRIPFKLSERKTRLVQVIRAVGSRYIVADNSYSIHAEIKNIAQNLEKFRRKSGSYLGNLTNGTVITLEDVSIIAKRDGRSFQVFLEIENFRVCTTGLPLPREPPEPFSTSRTFQGLSAHATGERTFEEETRNGPPARGNASVVRAASILSERSQQVTKSLQSYTPADDQEFERNVNKIIEDAASHTMGVDEQETPAVDVANSDSSGKAIPTQESGTEGKAEPQLVALVRSPLKEIKTNVPWKRRTFTDFNDLPLVRSVAVIPKDQEEFLQDKTYFLPVDPGKPQLSTPLPYKTHQELLALCTNAHETEPNEQLDAEKNYALSASQSSLQNPANTIEEPNYESSSEEEMIEWELTPSQNRTRTADSLPPDTPSSIRQMQDKSPNMVASPSLRKALTSAMNKENVPIENDTTPVSTIGMPAEVPQPLQPPSAGSLVSSPVKPPQFSTPKKNMPLQTNAARIVQGMSSPPCSPEYLEPSPTLVPSVKIPDIVQESPMNSGDEPLSVQSFGNNGLKRKSPSLDSSLPKRARLIETSHPSSPPDSRISSMRNSRLQSAHSSAVNSRINSPYITGHTVEGLHSQHNSSFHSSSSRKAPEHDPQVVYEEFKDAYPEYTGDFKCFTTVCTELHGINIPKFSYDDYIVRQRLDYPIWMVQQLQEGRKGLLYPEYYLQEVQQMEYLKGMMNPAKLYAVAFSLQTEERPISLDLS